MSDLLLYDYFRSSAGYRVRIALAMKGLSYRRHPVQLLPGEQRQPDYLARNPQGLVPALDIGGAVLTQSLAILDWLDRRYPEPRLLPDEPEARARQYAMALAIACDIHPIDNLRVLQYLDRELQVAKPDRDAWYAHWIVEGLTALERMAGDGRFLGGEEPGLADICLVPQLYNARRFSVPLDAFPKLVAIDAAATALPAFAAAHPDRCEEASGA
ncbi:maleylacetoacetate isomerase [Stakelama sediminis]|uniref:Maleylacetoacetate isomerase n=1 Tax=Stakelama sediminis TaxID=463200 RepID=A0A840YW17_9SPHN|nr:maleylacetoacetate isomerase [Stakelama sediminis]MBB5717747.1 maleylacetoacetate isomerase [Stakelama sediminis]